MRKRYSINDRPYLTEGEMTTIEPEERDLNFAKLVMPSLTLNTDEIPHVYADQYGIQYFGIITEVEHKTLTGKTAEQPIWYRASYEMTGGYFEPPDLDEVHVDEANEGYLCLTDACIATRMDMLERELNNLDPTCMSCFGGGEDIAGKCEYCNGKGYIMPVE